VEAARAAGVVHVASADDHELTDPEISAEPDFQNTYPPHCLRGTSGAEKIPETKQADPLPLSLLPFPPGLVPDLVEGRRELLLLKKNFNVFTNPNADPLLDALDVSPESFRLAAGLVLAVEGARALVWPRPADEPELPGLAAALVPVAFPLLLQPGVIVLALAAGAEDVAASGIGALAVALLLAAALPARALLPAGARVLGALEIVAGAALAVAAIADV
jgi:hypothetical protein